MASPVYSERFIQQAAAGTWVYYYVPAGHRAVLRHVDVVNDGTTDQLVQVVAGGRFVWAATIPGNRTSRGFESRVPCYAGEEIAAFHATTDMHITVSGYLFVDAGGGRGAPPANPGPPPAFVATKD